MVVGMYSSEPSSRGGMNSDPSFRKTGTVAMHQSQGAADHHPFPAQRPARDRFVEAYQEAADRVLLFGRILPTRTALAVLQSQRRPEMEIPEWVKSQPQRRVQGDRQHRGHDHGQGLGVGQGLEQPALLGLQGQHGQERYGDDQQGEEARPATSLMARTMTAR